MSIIFKNIGVDTAKNELSKVSMKWGPGGPKQELLQFLRFRPTVTVMFLAFYTDVESSRVEQQQQQQQQQHEPFMTASPSGSPSDV